MKTLNYISLIIISALMIHCSGSQTENPSESEIRDIIVKLERESLDEFSTGNVGGYALHADDNFTYFDNLAATELVKGKENFINYIKTAFGALEPHTYEIYNINVQSSGSMAVLEFEYISTNLDGEVQPKWITSSIYENKGGIWKSVHAHWTMITESSE